MCLFLADRTALHTIMGYWHHDVDRSSVHPSVTLCIVTFRVLYGLKVVPSCS